MSKENNSLRFNRLFDSVYQYIDLTKEIDDYQEDLKENIHKHLMKLLDIGLSYGILNDRSILTIRKITNEIYSGKSDFHCEDIGKHSKYFRSIIVDDSNLKYCITSNFAFCFMSISTALSCTTSSSFYYKFNGTLYWYHLYLQSYGSLVEKIGNGVARAKSKDNLNKQHAKNRAAKEMVFKIWDNGNPESGKAWCRYSDCAGYAVEALGIDYEKNTVERWLSRRYSRKKQTAINRKPE